MREPPSVFEEEVDIMGNPLAPGAVQPYDEHGTPLLRSPDGQLINPNTGEVHPAKAPRFSELAEPLDAFNRPLPPNAEAMFDAKGQPIGIGPDGGHYTPDGELVERSAPHFNAAGQQLSNEAISAAELVAPTIKVAVKARSMLKNENAASQAVDPLGRSFHSVGEDALVSHEGEEVPSTARRVEVGGELMSYEDAAKLENVSAPPGPPEPEFGLLTIKVENDEGEVDIGTVEVDNIATLSVVRTAIAGEVGLPDFVFLADGVPLTKQEELSNLAIRYTPEIVIRGTELKKEEEKPKKFTSKVAEMQVKQKKAEEEKNEFEDIMAKIRNKQFLKPVQKD